MQTNFKHERETAAEHRARAKSERLAEQRACYLKVDRRDGGCDRVDGRLSGNADLRDADGKLCGVIYETLTDGGFEVQAMV